MAQLAPFGIQMTDMELIENVSMEETESEKKEKEKEVEEEKEKFAQNHFFMTQIAKLGQDDCSSLNSPIPPAPYLKVSSPPPDIF